LKHGTRTAIRIDDGVIALKNPIHEACRLNFTYHDRALTARPARSSSTISAGCISEANSKLHSENIATGIV